MDLETYLNQYTLSQLSDELRKNGYELIDDDLTKDDMIYTIVQDRRRIESIYLLHYKYKKFFTLDHIAKLLSRKNYSEVERVLFQESQKSKQMLSAVGTRESSMSRARKTINRTKSAIHKKERKDKLNDSKTTKPNQIVEAIKRSETDIRKLFDFTPGKSICNYTKDLTDKLPILGKGVSGTAYQLKKDKVFKAKDNLSLVIKEVHLSWKKIRKTLVENDAYSTTKQVNEILTASILSELYTKKICINFSYYQSFIMCPSEENKNDITGYLLVEEMSTTLKSMVKYYAYGQNKPNLENYPIDLYEDIKALVFQYLCSFELMNHYYGAVHYDFHPDNAFIKLLDDKNKINNGTYNMYGTYYQIPEVYLLGKIADLDTVSMWGGELSDEVIIPKKYREKYYDEVYGHDINFKTGYDTLMLIQDIYFMYSEFVTNRVEGHEDLESICFDLIYVVCASMDLVDVNDSDDVIIYEFKKIFNDRSRPIAPYYDNISPMDIIESFIYDDYRLDKKPRSRFMMGTTEYTN